MSGILYVVATPIGNLEDVTLRALRILREVSLIAAEDTRRTARLLQHYSISTPATSLHEHNEAHKVPELVARLRDGTSIALVSDAGTPVVSDPGVRLVAAAHEAGVTVLPVPGPSAVVAAISAAGIPGEGFLFVGFPPARRNARRRWLEQFTEGTRPVVLYEAPHRIHALLEDLKEVLGDRTVAIGRELTKIHESLVIRPITHWLEHPPPAQGEFAVVIAPSEEQDDGDNTLVNDQILAAGFEEVAADGSISRREALRTVASRFGVSTRRVFAAVEASRR